MQAGRRIDGLTILSALQEASGDFDAAQESLTRARATAIEQDFYLRRDVNVFDDFDYEDDKTFTLSNDPLNNRDYLKRQQQALTNIASTQLALEASLEREVQAKAQAGDIIGSSLAAVKLETERNLRDTQLDATRSTVHDALLARTDISGTAHGFAAIFQDTNGDSTFNPFRDSDAPRLSDSIEAAVTATKQDLAVEQALVQASLSARRGMAEQRSRTAQQTMTVLTTNIDALETTIQNIGQSAQEQSDSRYTSLLRQGVSEEPARAQSAALREQIISEARVSIGTETLSIDDLRGKITDLHAQISANDKTIAASADQLLRIGRTETILAETNDLVEQLATIETNSYSAKLDRAGNGITDGVTGIITNTGAAAYDIGRAGANLYLAAANLAIGDTDAAGQRLDNAGEAFADNVRDVTLAFGHGVQGLMGGINGAFDITVSGIVDGAGGITPLDSRREQGAIDLQNINNKQAARIDILNTIDRLQLRDDCGPACATDIYRALSSGGNAQDILARLDDTERRSALAVLGGTNGIEQFSASHQQAFADNRLLFETEILGHTLPPAEVQRIRAAEQIRAELDAIAQSRSQRYATSLLNPGSYIQAGLNYYFDRANVIGTTGAGAFLDDHTERLTNSLAALENPELKAIITQYNLNSLTDFDSITLAGGAIAARDRASLQAVLRDAAEGSADLRVQYELARLGVSTDPSQRDAALAELTHAQRASIDAKLADLEFDRALAATATGSKAQAIASIARVQALNPDLAESDFFGADDIRAFDEVRTL